MVYVGILGIADKCSQYNSNFVSGRNITSFLAPIDIKGISVFDINKQTTKICHILLINVRWYMLTIIWTGYQGYSARKAAKYNMQLKKEKVQDLISCLLFVEFMYKSKKVQDIKRSQNVSLASINRQQKKSKGILHHIYSSKHFIKSSSEVQIQNVNAFFHHIGDTHEHKGH
jgi:hypothetical protein